MCESYEKQYDYFSFYKLAEGLQPILQNRSNLEALLRIQDDYNALVRPINNLQLLNISQSTGECVHVVGIILENHLPFKIFVHWKFTVVDSEFK